MSLFVVSCLVDQAIEVDAYSQAASDRNISGYSREILFSDHNVDIAVG